MEGSARFRLVIAACGLLGWGCVDPPPFPPILHPDIATEPDSAADSSDDGAADAEPLPDGASTELPLDSSHVDGPSGTADIDIAPDEREPEDTEFELPADSEVDQAEISEPDGDVDSVDLAPDAAPDATEPDVVPALGPCEAWSCKGAAACTPMSMPDGGACDDGDPCTVGDSCANGACLPGRPVYRDRFVMESPAASGELYDVAADLDASGRYVAVGQAGTGSGLLASSEPETPALIVHTFPFPGYPPFSKVSLLSGGLAVVGGSPASASQFPLPALYVVSTAGELVDSWSDGADSTDGYLSALAVAAGGDVLAARVDFAVFIPGSPPPLTLDGSLISTRFDASLAPPAAIPLTVLDRPVHSVTALVATNLGQFAGFGRFGDGTGHVWFARFDKAGAITCARNLGIYSMVALSAGAKGEVLLLGYNDASGVVWPIVYRFGASCEPLDLWAIGDSRMAAPRGLAWVGGARWVVVGEASKKSTSASDQVAMFSVDFSKPPKGEPEFISAIQPRVFTGINPGSKLTDWTVNAVAALPGGRVVGVGGARGEPGAPAPGWAFEMALDAPAQCIPGLVADP